MVSGEIQREFERMMCFGGSPVCIGVMTEGKTVMRERLYTEGVRLRT